MASKQTDDTLAGVIAATSLAQCARALSEPNEKGFRDRVRRTFGHVSKGTFTLDERGKRYVHAYFTRPNDRDAIAEAWKNGDTNPPA